MLGIPRPVAQYLSQLLAAHRRRINTPKGSWALGPFRQTILVLRWFHHRTCVHCLARGAGGSPVTGYRSRNEAIDVLADQVSDLSRSWTGAATRA